MWKYWGNIYDEIKWGLTTRCHCDNCKTKRAYIDEETLGNFLGGLEICLNVETIAIKRSKSNLAKFVKKPSEWGFSKLNIAFNLECKNKGWFECEKCCCYFSMKELGTKALTDKTEPFICTECLAKVEEQLKKDKENGWC